MILSSECQPWLPDQPGQAGIVVAIGSYTTAGDTTLIGEPFGVHYHERTIGKLLKHLGFSHISARPRHPAQDPGTITAFKKTSPARSRRISGP